MMFLTRMPALGVSATRSRHRWRPNDRDQISVGAEVGSRSLTVLTPPAGQRLFPARRRHHADGSRYSSAPRSTSPSPSTAAGAALPAKGQRPPTSAAAGLGRPFAVSRSPIRGLGSRRRPKLPEPILLAPLSLPVTLDDHGQALAQRLARKLALGPARTPHPALQQLGSPLGDVQRQPNRETGPPPHVSSTITHHHRPIRSRAAYRRFSPGHLPSGPTSTGSRQTIRWVGSITEPAAACHPEPSPPSMSRMQPPVPPNVPRPVPAQLALMLQPTPIHRGLSRITPSASTPSGRHSLEGLSGKEPRRPLGVGPRAVAEPERSALESRLR